MTFGEYPEVSFAMTRERYREAKKLLVEGQDLMAERKAIKTAQNVAKINSFTSVSALSLKHWREGKSARHADPLRRRMEAVITPDLSRRSVDIIAAPEVVAMAKAIEQRGALEIAKGALETTGPFSDMRSLMAWPSATLRLRSRQATS